MSAIDRSGTETRRALVAEDNVVNQKLVLRLLERRGFTAVVVANGREAVELLEAEAFDFVLMDIQMPEMSGVEATREIRTREKSSGGHLPIIALTANAMEGDRERFLAAGMDEYVSKPINTTRLFDAIESVAHQRSEKHMEGANRDPQKDGESSFDRTELLDRFDDDMEFLAEVAEQFREDLPGLLQEISDAASRNDGEHLERASHSLKGAASNFGAERVVSLAAILEASGSAGTPGGEDSQETIRQLVTASEKLSEELFAVYREAVPEI